MRRGRWVGGCAGPTHRNPVAKAEAEPTFSHQLWQLRGGDLPCGCGEFLCAVITPRDARRHGGTASRRRLKGVRAGHLALDVRLWGRRAGTSGTSGTSGSTGSTGTSGTSGSTGSTGSDGDE